MTWGRSSKRHPGSFRGSERVARRGHYSGRKPASSANNKINQFCYNFPGVLLPGVVLLDEAAGRALPSDPRSSLELSSLRMSDRKLSGVEGGEEEGLLPIGHDGLDGLGARGENRALLGHVFE